MTVLEDEDLVNAAVGHRPGHCRDPGLRVAADDLARAVLDERLRRIQLTGVVLAITGVCLIAGG